MASAIIISGKIPLVLNSGVAHLHGCESGSTCESVKPWPISLLLPFFFFFFLRPAMCTARADGALVWLFLAVSKVTAVLSEVIVTVAYLSIPCFVHLWTLV